MSYRVRLLLMSIAFLWQVLFTEDAFGQRQNATAHPWLATAPGEYVRLIQAGEVSVEEDDERLRKENKQAITFFTLTIDYRYTMKYQTVESGTEQQVVRVNVRYKKPTSQIVHRIIVGSDFKPALPWTNSLLMHEMDHVAISTDPRIENWIENFFTVERNWEFAWQQSTKPTDGQIQKKIVEKSQELTIDVERWIQFLYDQLDSESIHGTQDIANRSKFFAQLYSPETVAKCKIASFLALTPEQIRSGGKMPNRKLEAHFRIKIE
ncbi:MAG: hypothetical protein ACK5OC_13140 [Pirellula sp.]|jgi:hypothetical protein